VIIEDHKKVDLKQLEKLLNEKKSSLASSERLMKYLNVTAGSVSPFGIIYDKNKDIQVIIDKNLETYEKINFHPNNNFTLEIFKEDFLKFLEWTKNDIKHIKF